MSSFAEMQLFLVNATHYDMATMLIDAQATSVTEIGARHVDGLRRGEQLQSEMHLLVVVVV